MPQIYRHSVFGDFEFVRLEGVDWIVRSLDSHQLFRIPPVRRRDYIPIPQKSEAGASSPLESLPKGLPTKTASSPQLSSIGMGRLLWAIRKRDEPVELQTNQERDAAKGFLEESAAAYQEQNENCVTTECRDGTDQGTQSIDGQAAVAARSLDINEAFNPNSRCLTAVSLLEPRRLRRVFESLRNGLSPDHRELCQLAVGIESIEQCVRNLLQDVDQEGGRAIVLRGGYGQGKTFNLKLLRQMALDSGFVVCDTEINAIENPLDKPHRVYHSLLKHLTFPNGDVHGSIGLARRAHEGLRCAIGSIDSATAFTAESSHLLSREVQCRPLTWLLSDPEMPEKAHLVALLGGEPGLRIAEARGSHVNGSRPRDWPAFNAGTQGDFASYLLSGIGRLVRFLGYRGLIVILDEMEKWQDLDWRAQCRAGNLLGGLIWGASADISERSCKRAMKRCEHSKALTHSIRSGGYPFSTPDRCHLGLAIAMTPRGDDGPELQWSQYGLLEIVDLPAFTAVHLQQYTARVFPLYCRAYDMAGVMPPSLPADVVRMWIARGDGSARTGIQSAVVMLDQWSRR